ncbi:MAG: sulfotransferase domain-containing protein [Paracoccaceae bacterium]
MSDTPVQEHDYKAEVEDSGRWRQLQHRPGDVFVCTAPKNGTTWTQAICSLLIFGDPNAPSGSGTISPWVELTLDPIDDMNARLAAQTHRRFIKSHAPMDGIIWWEDAVYLAVCRHPLDMYFSLLKHGENQTDPVDNPIYNVDRAQSFDYWLNEPLRPDPTNNTILSAAVHHFKSFRKWQHLSNVHLLHYADMTRDLHTEMSKVAVALDISHPPELMDQLVEAATFDSMKKNAEKHAPEVHDDFWKDKGNFFHSGTSGKWHGKLTEDQLAAYDARMDSLLSPEERRWLEWGSV